MKWSNRPEVKKILIDLATEFNMTEERIVLIMDDFFESLVVGMKLRLVKFFRIPRFGSIRIKGYKKPHKSPKQNGQSGKA